MYYCKFLHNLLTTRNLVPLQKDMQYKWCNRLLIDGLKFKKKKYITFKLFNKLYVNYYQKDDLLRKYEYKKYKKNDNIYGIQITSKLMEGFPNEHFILTNGNLVSVKKTDWLVRSQGNKEIYVIQNKTLKNIYQNSSS